MCNGGKAFEQSQRVVGSNVLPFATEADENFKNK